MVLVVLITIILMVSMFDGRCSLIRPQSPFIEQCQTSNLHNHVLIARERPGLEEREMSMRKWKPGNAAITRVVLSMHACMLKLYGTCPVFVCPLLR